MAVIAEVEDGKLVDRFDHLPDALLLLIFSKILDAKSLVRCLFVSKRFASLIPLIDTVFLSIPRRIPDFEQYSCSTEFLKFLIGRFISKPLRFVCRLVARKPESDDKSENWFYSPIEALKQMKSIQNLQMELPIYDGVISRKGRGDPMIKWKAEFGTSLKSCVIFGASSVQRKPFSSMESLNSINQSEEQIDEFESVIGDEELKVRIMWTISCLVAASMRHLLVKKMVAEFPMLRRVVITDSTKQGKFCSNEEHVTEIRDSIMSEDSGEATKMEAAHFPDMIMKMCFVPELELKGSGILMKGATLAVIRPSSDKAGEDNNGDLLGVDFDTDGEDEDKVYGQAVREMVKSKRKYILEFSSS